MVSDPGAKTASPAQTVVAVVLQVREGRLQVLLWERALDPFAGAWSLPGGDLAPGETLEESIRRHLAAKVDVRELAHLEQLETRSDPDRNPLRWELATAYLGLVPADQDPALPADTRWHPVDDLPRARVRPPADRARRPRAPAREALVHEHRLRARAALVHDLGAARPATAPRSATTSRRRTSSACSSAAHLLVPTGTRREPGPSGGRPAALYGFRTRSSRSPTSSRCCGRLAALPPDPADERPGGRQRRGGEVELHDVARDERVDPVDERRVPADVELVVEPDDAADVDDDAAGQHRGDRRREPLVPAALGEVAGHGGGEHEADDVAAGRAAEDLPAVLLLRVPAARPTIPSSR